MNFLEIIKEVQATKKSIKTTPRTAIKYLGVSKRGWRINEQVNKLLEEHDVICEPKFEHAYFYGEIEIIAKPKVSAKKFSTQVEESDPTPRLSLLKTANLNIVKDDSVINNKLVSVNRDTTLSEAVTYMLIHDYSQLPILNGERTVDGIVSWKSIGKALALGHPCKIVNDCKDEATVLNLDVPLFDAVKIILEKEVVLVRQKNNTICGIVTISDIGEQFISLAEPFLIIEQIENHIRKILDGKFSIEELNAALDPIDDNRKITSLSDLNFGEYLKIIERPENFKKLGLNIDRVIFKNQLEEVRKIRNDVMHFDPEANIHERIEILRQTANFFNTSTITLKQ